jgi:putative membrane protein
VTAWLLPVLSTAIPAGLYLLGVQRWRSHGRAWPLPRTCSFLCGLVLIGAALSPQLDAATATRHMAQHLLLGMYAPIGLALGAPLTLLLAALRPPARRPIGIVLRSRAMHAVSHVTTAGAVTVGGLYGLYLTPLYALSTRSEAVHHVVHVHLLVSGYLFAWAVAGPDPAPRRPPMSLRIVVLVAAGGAHSFLAMLLYARAPQLPPGGQHGRTEMQPAGEWMYYGGHLADLVLLTALFAAWYRRRARRPEQRAGSPALGPSRARPPAAGNRRFHRSRAGGAPATNQHRVGDASSGPAAPGAAALPTARGVAPGRPRRGGRAVPAAPGEPASTPAAVARRPV